jgi:tRNA(Ile2) C34 agmatinyltransferase TiaS
MKSDEDFLLYPLDTGPDPNCSACGKPMLLAGQETRDGPDFIIFRCERCGRTEKFVCEE